ncbi:MAG: SsrA-binding protein SmpB [Planctomycetota bacterium]|nr:SsrA-binding protein SmpB [Planctomycetota bacterium]
MSSNDSIRPIASNRKARHLYNLLDEMEVGVELLGTEVKSLRGGQCSLQEAYVRIKGNELWLVGAHIPEYAFGNRSNHAPTRERKLLAQRRQIDRWSKAVREKGVTIVPLDLYFKGALIKANIALARGKRLHDKRSKQREVDAKREMDRAQSRRR